MQAYVDEAYLSGFQGLWFDAVKESKIPDFFLFRHLLYCQNAIDKGNKKAAVTELNAAIVKTKKIAIALHAILKARIATWNLILKKDSKTMQGFFNELTDPWDIADFAVFTSRLIWLYYSEKEIIPFLDTIDTRKYPVIKNYLQKRRYNILLLTLAIHHHH